MRKYSILLLPMLVVGLTVVQREIVVPLVVKVVNSELLTGNSAKGGQPVAIHDDRTAMAFLHCNDYIRHLREFGDSASFRRYDYGAWDIGFNRYLIKSHFEIISDLDRLIEKTYVCEIRYEQGDDADYRNWTLLGLDYA